MQVSDTELGTVNVDGQVDLATSRQVLDVAVTTVLRSAGDRAGTFAADLGFGLFICGTSMDVDRLGWVRDFTV